MDRSLRVAACQVSADVEPEPGLRAAVSAVREAAEQEAQLAVLPEGVMARFGRRLPEVAQPLDGRFAEELRTAADRYGVAVLAGLWEPADAGRVHNTLLLTGSGVERETVYRKIHLYDAYGAQESALVSPGDEVVTAVVHGVTVGLATCYDVRFGEQFTALGEAGAELVCLPACWGAGPGKDEQWELLVRARAHDAQAWLLAVDQPYLEPDGPNPLGIGLSALVDPTGHLTAQAGRDPEVLVADVDLDMVPAVRERVPVLSSRRA